MKIIFALAAALSFFAVVTYNFEKTKQTSAAKISINKQTVISPKAKDKPLVLVELFTSEGCVSCPPADRVLAQLEKNQPNPDAEIVTLAMHVDYWNNIAWKDRFSSAMFSQRQMIYGQKFKINSVYTPQMIVDGTKQFVGSNLNEANKFISESAKIPKANVELSQSDNNLKISISDVPKHTDATVFLAIAEDNLSTKVGGGENGGRTLEHSSVVRDLKPLGRILETDNKFETATVLQLQPDWKRENLKVVIFIQENQSRKIIGVGRINLDK